MSYQQRVVAQWLIVAIASCLAILCFLAALYHKLDLEHIGPSAPSRRRQLQTKLHQSYTQQLRPLTSVEWVQHDHRFVPVTTTVQEHRRYLQSEMMICNGHVNLCDRRVNETVFATVHNGMSALENGAILLKNHIRQLEGALQAGYRGLNLDIGTCNGQVTLIHTVCSITSRSLRSVLLSIVSFLQAHPYEVLIMPTELSTQLFASKNNITLHAIDQVFQSVPEFYTMLYNHPSPNVAWPTLRELITSNRRILFFHYNGESCMKVDTTLNTTNSSIVSNPCPYGFHPWFVYASETEYSFRFVKELEDTTRACRRTRGARGLNHFFGINVFITPARLLPTMIHINQYAFMKSHIDDCISYNNKTLANVVLVNYWGVGDVLDVIYDMNAALK